MNAANAWTGTDASRQSRVVPLGAPPPGEFFVERDVDALPFLGRGQLLARLNIQLVPPHALCPRFPAPPQTEALAMPADNGFRLDQDESRTPIGVQFRQANPKGLIAAA